MNREHYGDCVEVRSNAMVGTGYISDFRGEEMANETQLAGIRLRCQLMAQYGQYFTRIPSTGEGR